MRRAGSRGQHNPPFQPRRHTSPSGRCGGLRRRSSETQLSEGASSNPLPGTSSFAPEPFPPPVASQQGQSATFTPTASSVHPNLNGVGGECVCVWGRGFCIPLPILWPISGNSSRLGLGLD